MEDQKKDNKNGFFSKVGSTIRYISGYESSSKYIFNIIKEDKDILNNNEDRNLSLSDSLKKGIITEEELSRAIRNLKLTLVITLCFILYGLFSIISSIITKDIISIIFTLLITYVAIILYFRNKFSLFVLEERVEISFSDWVKIVKQNPSKIIN